MLVAGGSAPAKRYTIVGVVKFGGGASFGGAGVAVLTLPEAQRVVGERGAFDQIDVAGKARRHARDLRDRLRVVLPRTVDVRTGTEQASHDTSELESNLSFLRTFLLVFAYVSLVVGAFIIFNTFSITVAQRTREFGLLRTLGASRSQIMRSVLYEGFLLGTVGAMLGLLGRAPLAPALDQLFKSFGADLPDSGTVLETRTIVVAAGRRDRRDHARRPRARDPRHPRAAARRDARGCGDAQATAPVSPPLPGRQAAREGDRLAPGLARHHRAPGPRELDPPTRSYAHHGRRAHRRVGAWSPWWPFSPTAPRPRSTRRSAARSPVT